MKTILVLTQNVETNLVKQACDIVNKKVSQIGINFAFTFQETTRRFTSMPFGSMVLIDPAGILEEEKNFGNYDIDILVFDATKVTPSPTNPSENGNAIGIHSQWYNGNIDVLVSYLLHELCHEFYYEYGGQDMTHLINNRNWNPALYDKWFSQATSPDPYYVYLLSTFKQPTSPVVTITRTLLPTETLGVLEASNGSLRFSCKTLELKWANNAPSVSCIPTGTYKVKYTFSLKFLKYTYEIQNVPSRSGVRIHSANYFSDLRGCIALGNSFGDINKDGLPDVLNSKIAIKAFETLMDKKDFTLIIK